MAAGGEFAEEASLGGRVSIAPGGGDREGEEDELQGVDHAATSRASLRRTSSISAARWA